MSDFRPTGPSPIDEATDGCYFIAGFVSLLLLLILVVVAVLAAVGILR